MNDEEHKSYNQDTIKNKYIIISVVELVNYLLIFDELPELI
jgi:hypothetical protein